MNVSLSNLSGNNCILSSPIGILSSTSGTTTAAESPIHLSQHSSATTSPTTITAMTTGSLLQQLSNASFVNPAMAAAAAAAASVNRLLPPPSPMFTVEQLELIRRLRMTGISADAVLEAFNTLEKFESEMDPNRIQTIALAALMGNNNNNNSSSNNQATTTSTKSLFSNDSPLSTSNLELNHQLSQQQSQQQQQQILSQNVLSTTSPTLLQQLSSQAFGAIPSTGCLPPLSTPSFMTSNNSSCLSEGSNKGSPALSPDRCPLTFPSTAATIAAAANAVANSQDLSIFGHPTSTSSTPSTSSSSVSRPIRSQRTPMKEITTLDDPTELEDFMQQGEEGCINDMKQFITQFSLRQTTVAMMTGVSQPYISKLLNASFLQDPSTRLETNGDGELVPQRRERYVFRPILIKILETFFAETPFPDYNKRAEIASACNSALQMDKKGVGLMPKEIVSPQVVANWFANKRKEMRRRSNEEPMPHRLIQQNSENGDEPLTGTPSPLTPMDSANNLMEAENSCDLFQQFSNPFKAAFLNSAFTNSQNNSNDNNISNNMLMDSSTNSSPPALTAAASEPLANFDALMQSGLFNNLIGVYHQQQQQQQLQHQLHQHHNQQSAQQQSSNQSNNNNNNNTNNFVIKMEQTAE
uniref:Homeobox domain-containing protein n=1 Tax=Panagrolaimus sp. ES5 TaxID=591445 RepID=A0AC34FIJ0_9BILA